MVSEDLGFHWRAISKTFPDHPTFTFRSSHDGEYWFAVQTRTIDGKVSPTLESTIEPNMKVVVDSFPPTLLLEPDERRGSIASVRWEVKDENLDLKSLVLEYQVEGATSWRRVPISRPKLIGAQRWDAGTAEALKVRASVADRAGNVTEAFIDLPEGTGSPPDLASTSQEFDDSPSISQVSNGGSDITAGPGFTPVGQGPPSSRKSGSVAPRQSRVARARPAEQASRASKTSTASWDRDQVPAMQARERAVDSRRTSLPQAPAQGLRGKAVWHRLHPRSVRGPAGLTARRVRVRLCWSQTRNSSFSMPSKTPVRAGRRPSSSGSLRTEDAPGFAAAETPTVSRRSTSTWVAREHSASAWSRVRRPAWATSLQAPATRRKAGSRSIQPPQSSRLSPHRSGPA